MNPTPAVLRATLDPDQLDVLRAIPQGRWAPIDHGHTTAPLRVDADSVPARRAVEVLWPLFEVAGVPFQWLELSALKRQRDGGRCRRHTDAGTAFTRGRVLSMSVGLTPADLYEGGALAVAGHRIRLGEGDVVVFGADLPHAVAAVTRGVRYTLVARALGPDGHTAGQWLFGPGHRARRCPPPTEAEIATYRRQANTPPGRVSP